MEQKNTGISKETENLGNESVIGQIEFRDLIAEIRC